MAKMNFDIEDFTSAIPGAHALFVLIAMGAASFTLFGYSVGGTIGALSGMSIATVGVYATFGAGWFLRRSRKRLDTVDKVGLGLSGVIPLSLVIVQPLTDLAASNPFVGGAIAIPVIGGYIVTVER